MIKSNIKKEFNCTIEKIWHIITDNQKYSWRSDVSQIVIIDDTHFIEYDHKKYPTHFTITSKKRLKEYQFLLENSNIRGKWTGILKELQDKKVELDFTEEIETNKLIIKILSKPYLKKMQKRYLKDLEKEIKKEQEEKEKI